MRDTAFGTFFFFAIIAVLFFSAVTGFITRVAAVNDGYPLSYEHHESLAYGRTMVFVGEDEDSRLCFVTTGGRNGHLRLGCIPKADVLGGWTPEMGSHVMVATDPNGEEGFLLIPLEKG